MSLISRRQFCLFTGSTLAAFGLSQLNIQRQSQRYGKVLAQSTPRKLALLVGINAYPNTNHSRALRGCINDVESHKELLIHRFGFNANDIHTLTDEKATRQGILEAFEEHLIKQAKPGDVVVFTYSGHGSRVLDPDALVFGHEKGKTAFTGTFVPVDALLPPGYPDTGGVVQDIMGHTLFLLMSALQTENVTAVLDSCFSGGATRADFIARSRDGGRNIQISDQEKVYQDKWLSQFKKSRAEFVNEYRKTAKGVVLAATDTYQTAADARFNGFFAGAFTYFLTQYLWEHNSTVENAMTNISSYLAERFNQNPRFDVKVDSGYEKQPIFFIDPKTPPAQAVITDIKNNQATLWLGGLNKKSLSDLNRGTVLDIINAEGRSVGQVRLKSRDGLVGEATLEGTAEAGTLLRNLNQP
ncbi:MAG: hypothetical protein NVS2B14_02350 [Chamaesiphon sp.]